MRRASHPVAVSNHRSFTTKWIKRRQLFTAAVAEMLEPRRLLATINVGAGDTAGLIAAINAANNETTHPGADTINLAAGTYDFTAVDNNWYGPDALPPVYSNITIQGNGATLQRDASLPQTTAGAMRFFYVSGGIPTELPLGALTLKNLTLTNGLAKGGDSTVGGGGMGAGGAIFNQGNLTLNGVTLTGNTAMGGSSVPEDANGKPRIGGGGIGQDGMLADGGVGSFTGGGFGGNFPVGVYGGAGGTNGGGGFDATALGSTGGGYSGLGGNLGAQGFGGDGGSSGGSGGSAFGFGGDVDAFNDGGGGGVGGGGGSGGGNGFGGDGGFGGGGGSSTNTIPPASKDGSKAGGAGGFGGGGGGPYLVSNVNVGGFGGGQPTGVPSSSQFGGGGGGGMGGAVFSMFGSLTVINSTLTANTAQGGSNLLNFNGVVTGTGGSGFGGAIFNLDGTASITFSTLAANTVTGGVGSSNGSADGGALYNLAYGSNYDTGAAVISSASISDSILAGTIGGVHDLVNQEVDGNYPSGPHGDANTGNTATVTGTGPNVIGTISEISGGPNGTEHISVPGLIQTDPKLGALADNGGPTFTMALLTGSSAIGKGVAVAGITTDQRGVTRASPPDIGAFEATPAQAAVTFSNLLGPTIKLNTLAVTLGGTISGSGSTAPTGSVTITVTYASGPHNGQVAVARTAKIGTNGKFSATILSVFGPVGSYHIQYSYAGDANNAANSATTTGAVTYGIRTRGNRPTARHGTAVQVQVALIDVFGIDVSNPSVAVTGTGIALASSPNAVLSLPPGNGTGQFVYSRGTYDFNLKTNGLAAGTYLLYFTAAGDPVTHSVQFVLT